MITKNWLRQTERRLSGSGRAITANERVILLLIRRIRRMERMERIMQLDNWAMTILLNKKKQGKVQP